MQESAVSSAQLFDPRSSGLLDLMGPTVQFIAPPISGEPCIVRGVIPPGAAIPVHSHPDPETFIQLSGEVEALARSNEGFSWVKLAAGSAFHVPGDVRHAFRNSSTEPSVGIIATTARLGNFFAESAGRSNPDTRSSRPTKRLSKIF